MSGVAKILVILAVSTFALSGWFMMHDHPGSTLNSPRTKIWEDGNTLPVFPNGAGGGADGGGERYNASLAVQREVVEMASKMRDVTNKKEAEIIALRKAVNGGLSSSGKRKEAAGQGNVAVRSSPAETSPSKPTVVSPPRPSAAPSSSCAHQSLLHGATLGGLENTYKQNGKYKWALVDAFVSRGESVEDGLKGSSLITFIVTAHVYAGPPYNLPVGKAKPRRRNDYDNLMQEAGIKWTCTFGGDADGKPPSYRSPPAVAPKFDGDKHTLVVHCKPPQTFHVATSPNAAGSVGSDGRLASPVGLEATLADESTALQFRNVHACTAELVPPELERGACTMFGEMEPLNAAKAAATWTRFMLAAGFQFVALYLDASIDTSALEDSVRKALAAELSAGTVSLVRFHMSERVAFETQTAQQMHCHWRFRGRTEWLAQLDIDEYLQPLGAFQTISDVLAKYQKKNAAALQVRNRYWDHHPVDEPVPVAPERHDVWNMVWRDGRKSMHGREKLIYRPDMVDYMAVHRVTLGGKMAKPNAGTEIRHNHFSRHFKGIDDGVGCGGRESQGKHCQGAMQDVVKDLSFQEFYHRIMKT